MVPESHQGVGNEKDGNEYQIPIGIQHNMKKKQMFKIIVENHFQYNFCNIYSRHGPISRRLQKRIMFHREWD